MNPWRLKITKDGRTPFVSKDVYGAGSLLLKVYGTPRLLNECNAPPKYRTLGESIIIRNRCSYKPDAEKKKAENGSGFLKPDAEYYNGNVAETILQIRRISIALFL